MVVRFWLVFPELFKNGDRMAAKLKCPRCGKMLKEQGDEMKQAQGEYRILEPTPYAGEISTRLVMCLCCGFTAEPMEYLL